MRLKSGVQNMSAPTNKSLPHGLAQAIFCYLLWGVLPLYWKLLSSVSALEVLGWRMVFSALILVAMCTLVLHVRFMYFARDKCALKTFITSGLIVSFNWGLYVWAVNAGYVLEASIGYYLCPLSTVLLGQLMFKESLSRAQMVAVALAAVGVAFFIANQGGKIWISLSIALSFSFYGAVKKKGAYPALAGLTFESVITGCIGVLVLGLGLAYPRLVDLSTTTPSPLAIFDPTVQMVLLVGAGACTALPLLLFSSAANKITMTDLGFIQYLGPTIAMTLGVLVFGEHFTVAHAVMVVLVWSGIALVAVDAILRKRLAAKLRM